MSLTHRLAGLALALALTAACGSARVQMFAAPNGTAAPTVNPGDPVGTDLDTPLPPGDAANGDKLFHGKGPGSQYPCSACHSLKPGQTLVGPSLGQIATVAATRRSGYSAEKYIRESIVSPHAFIVPGFNDNIMPLTFAAQMSKQDLADILAFLLTQK